LALTLLPKEIPMAQDDDLYDAYNVPEYFIEGLARIDQVGPCRRMIFFTRGPGPGRSPVVRIVLPAEILVDVGQMIVEDIRRPNSRLSSLSADALVN
jgi:hypothetical protein